MHSFSLATPQITPKHISLIQQAYITSPNFPGLAGKWLLWWFWLRVPCEISLGLLARAIVFSRLDWGWRSLFQAHACGYWQAFWVLAGGPQFLTCHKVVHNMAASFPQSEREREREREAARGSQPNVKAEVMYNLISKMTFLRFCHVLLTAQTNLGVRSGDDTRVCLAGGKDQ